MLTPYGPRSSSVIVRRAYLTVRRAGWECPSFDTPGQGGRVPPGVSEIDQDPQLRQTGDRRSRPDRSRSGPPEPVWDVHDGPDPLSEPVPAQTVHLRGAQTR